ncbi:hypothetical protein VNI00_018375 [Paramarasmius palmivorus]|uniref:Uncharacterized protein n=1 Tax=Paramarasmius palmivorus TaxID=297713 RepID=A0AAW0AXN7_9AGAR
MTISSQLDRPEEVVAPYLQTQIAVTLSMKTTTVTFLVYGIYIIVFYMSISVFREYPSRIRTIKNDDSGHKYVRTGKSTIVMFVLATILNSTFAWHYYGEAELFYETAKSGGYTPMTDYQYLMCFIVYRQ